MVSQLLESWSHSVWETGSASKSDADPQYWSHEFYIRMHYKKHRPSILSCYLQGCSSEVLLYTIHQWGIKNLICQSPVCFLRICFLAFSFLSCHGPAVIWWYIYQVYSKNSLVVDKLRFCLFFKAQLLRNQPEVKDFHWLQMANVIERVNCSGASEQWVVQELGGFLQLAETVIFNDLILLSH